MTLKLTIFSISKPKWKMIVVQYIIMTRVYLVTDEATSHTLMLAEVWRERCHRIGKGLLSRMQWLWRRWGIEIRDEVESKKDKNRTLGEWDMM